MRIAIVEDMPEDQAELTALLNRYCSDRKLEIQLSVFSSAEDFLPVFSKENFQVIFLDIYMNGMNGMEAARLIFRTDPSCRLFFLTTSHIHAVESYEVRASWYFLKPVSYDRLAEAMDTACRHIINEQAFISVHSDGIRTTIPLKDILFVDNYADCACLHLEDRVLMLDERIKEILSVFEADERFISCNRNTIVNMDWINTVSEQDFHLKNGELVPIKQRGRRSVKKQFLTWSLRNLRQY